MFQRRYFAQIYDGTRNGDSGKYQESSQVIRGNKITPRKRVYFLSELHRPKGAAQANIRYSISGLIPSRDKPYFYAQNGLKKAQKSIFHTSLTLDFIAKIWYIKT